MMYATWGFLKIRGYPFGVPIIRIRKILGSILGSHYLGKLPRVEKSLVSTGFLTQEML